MKTDAELNRLIVEHVTKPTQIVVDKDFDTPGVSPAFYWTYPVIDYCTDPAAWGALFVWLAEQKREVRIGVNLGGVCSAVVSRHLVSDYSPGRALVLATLAAYGVEVDE